MCARELPGLQRVAAELRGRGLELVTVMLDGTPEWGQRFVARVGVSAPVVLGDDEVQRGYQVAAYPWTVVFARDGKAVLALRGARPEHELREAFERVL